MWCLIKGLPVEGLLALGFTLSFLAAGLLRALPFWAIPLAVATIAVFRRSTKLGLVVGLGAIFIFMAVFIFLVMRS